MSTPSTWLEVALNGPWARERQPLIPVSVEDIVAQGVACARAGAAIVHVHAYDERSGRQRDDADLYTAIIEGIRERADVIVYPTIPFAGSADATASLSAEQRFAHIEALAARGLLEWAVVDPGTTHISRLAGLVAGEQGFTYTNPESHIRHGLSLAAHYRFHPGYAVYEPGFLRLGAALARALGAVPQPVYRFMFSSGMSFGFPPERFALEAYLELLAREAPGAPWMVAGLDVDVTPLIEAAVAHGGHVRVGLEDAPLGTQRTNLEWLELALRRVRAAGGEPAGAAEVRAALAERTPAA